MVTVAELALLSLIAETPRHGYGLTRVIDERGMREWVDLGRSSVYHVLHRLEADGMIEGRSDDAGGGPSRTVFHATDAGRAALRAGIRDALAEPQRSGSTFLLGLANLPVLPERDVGTALEDRVDALHRERTRLADIRTSIGGRPLHVDAMFDHTQALITAELEWLDRFRKEMP